MATNYYATYKRFNGTEWDTFYFTTVANQVAETSTRKWLTNTQQGWLNDYLDPLTYNTPGQLVALDEDGLLTEAMIPGGLGYLSLTGGTMSGNIDLDGNKLKGVSGTYGNLNTNLVLGIEGLNNEDPENPIVTYNPYLTMVYNATSPYLQAQYQLDMNNKKIVDLANATNSQDAATWGQVQSLAADGLKPMPPLKAATTTNITLSGLQMIDDYQLVNEDRLLVKNQTDPLENGVYTVASGDWTRLPNQSTEGYYGQILNGAVNKGTWFYAAEHPTVSGAFEWLLHSVPDEYGVISNGGLEIIGMNFGVKSEGITNAMLAGSIANDKLLDLLVTKISDFVSADLSTPLTATTSQGVDDHISNLYGMVKTIKGTTNSVDDAGDTIITLRTDLDTKNRTYIGDTAPSTTGYISGDLFFQYITPIN
jgi:hypothetical protein